MPERTEAVMERNSRRRGFEVVVGDRVAAMAVVGLGLMGGSDFGVDVGVMSVGEAMVIDG